MRATTLALVGLFLLATHTLVPDAGLRAETQYLLVLPLGYGHLLGAMVFSRRRLGRFVPIGSPGLFGASLAVSTLSLFAAYSWALGIHGVLLVLPLLAVSTWHTVENDLALGEAYRKGLRLEPIPRRHDHHLVALAATALVLLAAATAEAGLPADAFGFGEAREAGTPALRALGVLAGVSLLWRHGRGTIGLLGGGLALGAAVLATPGLALADVVAGSTLYHVLSWLVFFSDRVRALARSEPREARRLAARLAWVHALPVALCGAVVAGPAEPLAPLRFAITAPAIYLFWSVLHVFQTALARGLAARTT